MVLGSLSKVSLKEAHQVAGEQRQLVCQNKSQTKGIVLAYS